MNKLQETKDKGHDLKVIEVIQIVDDNLNEVGITAYQYLHIDGYFWEMNQNNYWIAEVEGLSWEEIQEKSEWQGQR